MPICIECCYPVSQLYHVLHGNSHKPTNSTTNPTSKNPPYHPNSGATGASKVSPEGGGESKGGVGGADVRLTQCPRCKRFADKYVEHDFVVLFIDLVLVKPQVYRHLLFNRLAREDDEFDPSITRLGTLLFLFDVYLTWSSIESLPTTTTSSFPIPRLPILLQYIFYLLYCTLTTLAQHLAIRSLAQNIAPARGAWVGNNVSSPAGGNGPQAQNGGGNGGDSRPNAISTALFVSSCMKLFPILMVVWKYDDVGGQVGRGVEWAVAVQNLEALRILLGCSYLVAGLLVAVGSASRWVVGNCILGIVGLKM